MSSLSFKILQLNYNIVGKTYTTEIPTKKKYLFSDVAGTIQTYYVIRHNNNSISLLKDEKVNILTRDDAFYNPWKAINEKAIEEGFEIHNLDHWLKPQTKQIDNKQKTKQK